MCITEQKTLGSKTEAHNKTQNPRKQTDVNNKTQQNPRNKQMRKAKHNKTLGNKQMRITKHETLGDTPDAHNQKTDLLP